ncbi:transposase, partial [Mycolicibacterium pallens]
ITELQTQIDAFVDEYNHRRPHRSLPHRATPATMKHPRFCSDLYRRIRSMPRQYSPEFRDRALRLLDTTMEASDISEFEAIKSVASKLGISEESVRRWRRKAQVDAGERPGTTSSEHAEIRKLKREVAELRRANELLKSASAFFAAELDRPVTK